MTYIFNIILFASVMYFFILIINTWLLLTQITNTEIFTFIAVLVFKLLSRNVLFINWKDNRNCWKVDYFLRKKETSRENYSKIVGTWNLQRTFETRKWSFISAFSICMTVPLINISNFNTDMLNQLVRVSTACVLPMKSEVLMKMFEITKIYQPCTSFSSK